MFSKLKLYCDNLVKDFSSISLPRKQQLDAIAAYALRKLQQGHKTNLVYICTHNSRRSHFGQVWAKAASHYYGLKNITTFSGGTEATAFNLNAIQALSRAGFKIETSGENKNPLYYVVYDENEKPVECFSKTYNHPDNPKKEFAAIMTCADAEEKCPFIPGAELRVATPYEDPKIFDDTPEQDAKYDDRCAQIAIESLYIFSKVK